MELLPSYALEYCSLLSEVIDHILPAVSTIQSLISTSPPDVWPANPSHWFQPPIVVDEVSYLVHSLPSEGSIDVENFFQMTLPLFI